MSIEQGLPNRNTSELFNTLLLSLVLSQADFVKRLVFMTVLGQYGNIIIIFCWILVVVFFLAF